MRILIDAVQWTIVSLTRNIESCCTEKCYVKSGISEIHRSSN